VTAAFLGLLIWKSLLESHEDDQIFLGTTEQHLAREQQLLVAKINTLSRPLMMTGILAGVLLLSPLPESGCITPKAVLAPSIVPRPASLRRRFDRCSRGAAGVPAG